MDSQQPHQTNLADLSGWRPGDRDWAARFIYVLGLKTNLPTEKLEKTIEEARLTTQDSDLPAQELFGNPDRAAILAASHHTTPKDRSNSRIMTTSEALSTSLMLVGFLIFVLTWFVTDYSTWTITRGYNLLFVLCLGSVFALGSTLVWSWVTKGKLVTAAITLLVALASALAVTFCLGERFGTETALPMYTGLLAGIALFVGGIMATITGGYYSAKRDEKEDTRDWFTQLEGFLRGQHAMSKKEARTVVAEARSHMADLPDAAATDPQVEFGSARAYAQDYAGSSIKLIKRKAKLKIAFAFFQMLCMMYLSYSFLHNNSLGWLTWPVGILVLFIFIAQTRTHYTEIKKEEKRLIKEAHDG